jgi:putative acetyltransferase
MKAIKLRTAELKDIPAIGRLYADTVRNINSKDYSPKHIKVWSASGENPDLWENRIHEQYFVIAETNNIIAGFGSIASNGYLDFMYIHKDYQRMGIAKALLDEIERKAAEQGNPQIYSHVSKTARGFFERFGYQHVRNIEDTYKGVVFINNLMVKNFADENLNQDITTARTLLRKYTEADRETSVRLSLDNDVMHFMGGEHAETAEEANIIFDKCFEIYKGWLGDKPLGPRHFELWGIEFEGSLIGHFELKQTPNTTGNELEVVYLLDKDYWGKGIIPEALNSVNDYAKSMGKQVIATINPDNKRTVRSLEKAGIEKQMWVEDSEGKVYKVWLK